MRRDTPALRSLDLDAVHALGDDAKQVLVVRRGDGDEQALVAFNFSDQAQTLDIPFGDVQWQSLMETGATLQGGSITLPPNSFAVWAGR
jgi:glycosidase